MEHALEHAKSIKGSINDLKRINNARKIEKVLLPSKKLWSCGSKLTIRGREINTASRMINFPAGYEIKSKKSNKTSTKNGINL